MLSFDSCNQIPGICLLSIRFSGTQVIARIVTMQLYIFVISSWARKITISFKNPNFIRESKN